MRKKFRKGDRVIHPVFGKGSVLGVRVCNNSAMVDFGFYFFGGSDGVIIVNTDELELVEEIKFNG